MGLLDWLFGNSNAATSLSSWSMSENGNPTRVIGTYQITVFEQDGGWKYCISKVDGDDNPYFSDLLESMAEAKQVALAEFD